jgi:hypothetical protein
MSIPLSNARTHKINQTQFIAEFRIFSIARHHAIEISPDNNDQKITIMTVKTNKLAGAVKAVGGPSRPLTERFLRDTARAPRLGFRDC